MNLKAFALDPLAFFAGLIVPSALGNKPFGEVMAPHQTEWFEAIAPAMVAVSKGTKPEIGRFWSERTKGGSKDSDIACVLLWLLAFSKQKLDMQVGAADKDQANELKKAATDILRLNPWLGQRVQSQTWSLVCKATGSECTILATDIAGSHGARPDIVVMNELSHVTKEDFAANLLDNATKRPNGLVIVATNAGLTGSWQEQWRDVAKTSDRWNFHVLSEPSPWLSEEEVQEAQRRNSRSRFNRLFYGIWGSGSGDALDQQDIDEAVDKHLRPQQRAQRDWFYVAGLDLGIKHDHSAIVVIGGQRSTQKLRLVHTLKFEPTAIGNEKPKVDLMKVERAVVDIYRRFRPRVIGYDPWQAALMAARCEHQGVRMSEVPFSGKNLNQMATTLLDVFRSHRIELYNEPALVSDLERLMIVEKSYGHRLEATRDANGHADLATALAIALPIATEKLGGPAFKGGGISMNGNGLTPYEQYLAEQEELGGPEDHNEPFRRAMQLLRPGLFN